MSASQRDIDATILQLPVKEGMAKYMVCQKDACHHRQHRCQREFIAHRQFQNDDHAGYRRADHRRCHRRHSANPQNRAATSHAHAGKNASANHARGGPDKQRR